jgi:hypothetical protein
MIVMVGLGKFHADCVIVADTGWENDMLLNTGERMTAGQFFEKVTKPLASEYGIDAYFVRVVNKDGYPYAPIPDAILHKRALAGSAEFPGKLYGLDVPFFGSDGGQLNQACTSKWKKGAIHQQLRRLGATTATCSIGYHLGEAHRMKPSSDKWVKFNWPLVDCAEGDIGGIIGMGINERLRRQDCYDRLDKAGIPYIITTQCDGCPHKDWPRWERTSQENLAELARFESQLVDSDGGRFYLTSYREPLLYALPKMRRDYEKKRGDMFDVCDSGFCFID